MKLPGSLGIKIDNNIKFILITLFNTLITTALILIFIRIDYFI